MFEILEKEPGIEMALEGEKSYKEFMYFGGGQKKPLNDIQYAYMLQRYIKWMPSMIMTALCISLHRQEGWGFERLSKFIYRIDLLRELFGTNLDKYADMMVAVTGHHPKEFWENKND